MRWNIAGSAGAIAALAVSGILFGETIEVGLFQQAAPRPTINYFGGHGSFISSSLVANPQERTLVAIDLYGLMQAAGLNYLESVQIFDPGGNQYLTSPGADIDYFALTGFASGTSVFFAYEGPNNVHLGESSEQMAARLGAMDAITGDQDYNSPHFVSLGLNGALTATFSGPSGGGQSGGGQSGGFGPDPFGGGEPGQIGSSPLIQVIPGMTLWISEAGLGEWYAIRLVGFTIPGPGPLALGALALLSAGARRRRRCRVQINL